MQDSLGQCFLTTACVSCQSMNSQQMRKVHPFFARFTFQKHTGVKKVTGGSTGLVTRTPPTVDIHSLRPARSRLKFVP